MRMIKMSKITKIIVNDEFDLSGEIPEGINAWFNVLTKQKRIKILKQLMDMI